MKKTNRVKFTVIFTGELARHLLRQGFQILDVMPHRDMPSQTVFIFEETQHLLDVIREYSKNNKYK